MITPVEGGGVDVPDPEPELEPVPEPLPVLDPEPVESIATFSA